MKGLLFLLGCAALLPLLADVYTWQGGASGDWNVSGNWSVEGGVTGLPTSSDTVVFTGTCTVTIPAGETAQAGVVKVFQTGGAGSGVTIAGSGTFDLPAGTRTRCVVEPLCAQIRPLGRISPFRLAG